VDGTELGHKSPSQAVIDDREQREQQNLEVDQCRTHTDVVKSQSYLSRANVQLICSIGIGRTRKPLRFVSKND
jgi:hypothetical protein